jgi:hypothetical protein
MKNFNMQSKLVAALAVSILSSSAIAQTVVVDNTVAVVNTANHVSTATLTFPAATVAGLQFTLTYDNANLGLPTGTAPHPEIISSDAAISCQVNTVGTALCTGFAASGFLTSPITIGFRFDIGATAIPTPGSPLTVSGVDFFDGSANSIPGSSGTNGSVIITTAPPNILVSYAPTAGSTISFPTGVALTTQTAAITVTGAGSVGTATVDNCALSGAGASNFAIVTGSVTVPPTDTIDLSCTLPNSGGAASAVLTCRENDSDSTNVNRTWNLSCPQGTPVPGPGYSSVPAPGATLNCDGEAGTTETVSFVVTNNGNPGAGSGLDFNCTTASPGFTIQSGGSATGLAVGGTQTVTVACTVPAEGAPASTGTVACTTNAGAAPTYLLSSLADTLPEPVPQPNVVPASSLWSKLALIGLLAGLGIAVVGFRRS